jgi:hypothetical protein
MKAVFADTSYFTALANPQDEWHHAARDWGAILRCRLVVTEYVLLELGNALVVPIIVPCFCNGSSVSARTDRFRTSPRRKIGSDGAWLCSPAVRTKNGL